MKSNEGMWEYCDGETGITVFINYLITDESFDHHFGREYKIGVEADLERVEDRNGNLIAVDNPDIETIIEDAFESLDNAHIKDLLSFEVDEEGRYREEDIGTVGWQYLHNKNINWN